MKSIIGGSTSVTANGNAIGSSSSFFWPLGMTTLGTSSSADERGLATANFAGRLTKLRAYFATNTLTTASILATVKKNGVDTAMGFTVPPGVTGWFSDFATEVEIAPDDTYTLWIRGSTGGSGAVQPEGLTTVVQSEGADYSQILSCHYISSSSSNSYTYYGAFAGDKVSSTTINETNRRTQIRKALTLSYFKIFVSTNSRITNTTLRVRKNSANGAQSIVVPGGVTGTLIDISNTDSFVSGDALSWSWAAGTGSGTFNPLAIGATSVSQAGFSLYANSAAVGSSAVTRAASDTPTFYQLVGAMQDPSTEEARLQIPVDLYANLTNFMLRVSANTSSGAVTVKLRKNGADANQNLTIAAGTTGLFEDVTNNDDTVPSDMLSKSVVGGTSGILTMVWGALFGTDETPAPPAGGGDRKIALLGRPQVLGGADLQILLSPPAVN